MVSELVENGRERLRQAPFDASAREVCLLLGHVLGLSETQVLARWDEAVEPDRGVAFEALLERRLRGEPVAYLLGKREFYGRDFRVDSRVLIPRPETEHLVEAALSLPLGPAPAVLDLGTGSGCIAITLALERPRAAVVAVDLSVAALALAADNKRALGATNVRLAASDLSSSLALGDFDLVVSNPPYVGREEEVSLSIEVRGFEPQRALFPKGTAESVVGRLIEEGSNLRSGAFLLIEIGHLQGRRAEELIAASDLTLERMVPDYQGIPRVVVARRK